MFQLSGFYCSIKAPELTLMFCLKEIEVVAAANLPESPARKSFKQPKFFSTHVRNWQPWLSLKSHLSMWSAAQAGCFPFKTPGTLAGKPGFDCHPRPRPPGQQEDYGCSLQLDPRSSSSGAELFNCFLWPKAPHPKHQS